MSFESPRLSYAVAAEGQGIRIHAGKRHLSLRAADFGDYAGERAQRGRMLPRGYKNPGRVEPL